jgi:hypothetical protein
VPATSWSSPGLSRMARSVRHLTEVAALLAEREGDLVVLKQGINTTTPAGRFLFHVIKAMDEMVADLISEARSKDSKPHGHADAPAGANPSPHHPTGHRRPADV